MNISAPLMLALRVGEERRGPTGSGNFRSFMVSKESPIFTTKQEMNFPR